MTKVIKVAEEFTPYPGGRFKEDGKYSGEAFRDEFIIPNLKCDQLCFDMENVRGFGSSFLEEAFGGLIRKNEISAEELSNKIRFENILQSIEEEIKSYIQEAKL